MKAKLIVSKNESVIQTIELLAENDRLIEYYIGRSVDCHLVLDDQKISRHHACIFYKDNKWWIQKKSEYGNIIQNNKPIGPIEKLSSGDVISIPPFQLQIIISDEIVPVVQNEAAPIISQQNNEATKIIEEVKENTLSEEKEQNFNLNEQTDSKNVSVSIQNESSENIFTNEQKDESSSNQFGEFNAGTDSSGQLNEEGSVPNTELQDEGEKTQIFGDFSEFILELSGENIPYERYLINLPETLIGRDAKKCQIALKDNEASSIHSSILRSNSQCVLKDLGSSNGTILNGVRVNESILNHGDEFIIGNTNFKFVVKSKLVEQEKNTLMPVENIQTVEVTKEVEEEVSFLDEDKKEDGTTNSSKSLFSKDALKDPNKRKKLLYIVIAVLAIYVFLDEDNSDKTTDAKKENSKENKKIVETKKDESTIENKEAKKKKRIFTPEEIEYLEASYVLAKEYFSKGMYKEAEFEVNKIFSVSDDGYKEAKQLKKLIQEGYKQIALLEQKKQKEIEEQMRKKKVDELLEKARDAVKEKKIELAEPLFSKILEIDPEQPDVGLMKMEVDAWKKEKERKEIEEAQKKAERQRQEGLIAPGKTHYLKKEWYKAIIRLDEFLQNKNIDEDLIKDGTKMLQEAKENLDKEIEPILTKARSLKEGQDLKGAYEQYLQILNFDPNYVEALNEISSIKDSLDTKARKIYWEGIISESLSLFSDAKEKFQQVQQMSPIDGHYYKRATEKLKKYIE